MCSGQSGSAGGFFSPSNWTFPPLPFVIPQMLDCGTVHLPCRGRSMWTLSLASLLELKKTTDFSRNSIFSDIRLYCWINKHNLLTNAVTIFVAVRYTYCNKLQPIRWSFVCSLLWSVTPVVLLYVLLCCSMYCCVALCILVLFYVFVVLLFVFVVLLCVLLCYSMYSCVVLCIDVLLFVFVVLLFVFVVLLYVFVVLLYVFLCCSMYFSVLLLFVLWRFLYCLCVYVY
jgi:hypothetical protein